MSRDLAKPSYWKILWLYEWELLIVCHHPDKFGSQRHCVSGDVIFLIYHIILQDHLIKGSSDFMARSLLKKVITMPSLEAIDIAVVSIWLFQFVMWFPKTTLKFHVTLWTRDAHFFSFFLKNEDPLPIKSHRI